MTERPRRAVERLAAWWQAPASSRSAYAVSAAIGLALYLIVFGPGHMFGTSEHWDLPLQDSRAYLMGYRYFLHEPWHWPVFVTHTMNVPFPKSIAFTDSIPLWAFVNKAIATVIPPWGSFSERAYLGLWYGIVFALQPALAVANLRVLGCRSWGATILTALFFIAVPAWTSRYVHASLSAHFLTLWALYLYLRTPAGVAAPRRLRVLQLVQLGVTAMINPYHTLFSFGLFVASVLRSKRLKSIAIWAPLGLAAIGTAAWLSGYFARDAKLAVAGFETSSTNVLSMFMPWRSGLFGDALWVNPTGYQYEGIAYLGIGFVALFALFLPKAKMLRGVIKRHPFLFALALGAWLFALSNHIYVGSHELVSYSFPSSLSWVADQFRCPGRFVWVPMYVLMVFLLRWALTRFSLGWKQLILPGLAILQIVDASGDWRIFRDNTRAPKNAYVKLEAWRPLVHAHEAIYILPSYDCILDGTLNVDQVSLDIQYLASERALPINGVYSARPTRDCKRDFDEMLTMTPRDNTLYVVLRRMQSVASRFEAQGLTCGEFEFGRACSRNQAAIEAAIAAGGLQPTPPPMTLAYGAKLEAGDPAATPYFDIGWSWPESWGRWSEGVASRLLFHLEGEPPPGVALNIQAATAICGDRTVQDVEVVLDGTSIGTLHFDARSNNPAEVRRLPIARPDLLHARMNVLELRPSESRKPSAARCSEDPRALGISLTRLWFE